MNRKFYLTCNIENIKNDKVEVNCEEIGKLILPKKIFDKNNLEKDKEVKLLILNSENFEQEISKIATKILNEFITNSS